MCAKYLELCLRCNRLLIAVHFYSLGTSLGKALWQNRIRVILGEENIEPETCLQICINSCNYH